MATAAQILAAIDTAIYNIVAGEVESVEIRGKQWTLQNVAELRLVRREYVKDTCYSRGSRKRVLLADISRGAG